MTTTTTTRAKLFSGGNFVSHFNGEGIIRTESFPDGGVAFFEERIGFIPFKLLGKNGPEEAEMGREGHGILRDDGSGDDASYEGFGLQTAIQLREGLGVGVAETGINIREKLGRLREEGRSVGLEQRHSFLRISGFDISVREDRNFIEKVLIIRRAEVL